MGKIEGRTAMGRDERCGRQKDEQEKSKARPAPFKNHKGAALRQSGQAQIRSGLYVRATRLRLSGLWQTLGNTLSHHQH
jgi:hypothetical protein